MADFFFAVGLISCFAAAAAFIAGVLWVVATVLETRERVERNESERARVRDRDLDYDREIRARIAALEAKQDGKA